MPWSRRRCTSRSRVRAEVMPMPAKRGSVGHGCTPVEPFATLVERRMAGEVRLQRRHRDEPLRDRVEVGARARLLLPAPAGPTQ